jgi:hypothetical protein
MQDAVLWFLSSAGLLQPGLSFVGWILNSKDIGTSTYVTLFQDQSLELSLSLCLNVPILDSNQRLSSEYAIDKISRANHYSTNRFLGVKNKSADII